jgi:hypothetical protein
MKKLLWLGLGVAGTIACTYGPFPQTPEQPSAPLPWDNNDDPYGAKRDASTDAGIPCVKDCNDGGVK